MKRRWIFYLLVILFVWIVVTRFTEIKKLAGVLAQGQWQWVLAAGALTVMYYIIFSAIYWSAANTVQVRSRVESDAGNICFRLHQHPGPLGGARSYGDFCG